MGVMNDIYSKYICEDSPLQINLAAGVIMKIENELARYRRNPEQNIKNFETYSASSEKECISDGIPDIFNDALYNVYILIKTNMSHKFRFPPEAWKNARPASPRNSLSIFGFENFSTKKRAQYTSAHTRYNNDFSKYTTPT